VATRAELTVDIQSLEGLDTELATLLAERLGLHARTLRITSQEERLLARNRELAARRLAELMAEALAPPPPPRRRTRPPSAAREERLSEKSRRASVKRLRQRPADAQ
jgi:ribosome-associated protein